MKELKNRKSPRLQGFDYNRVGAYFITICTKDRKCILSRISSVGTGVLDCPNGVLDCPNGVLDCPQIELTRYGKIADKYIHQLNDFYDDLSVESYVIMPNHIHILLWVKDNENGQSRTPVSDGQSRTPVPTIDITTRQSRANSVFSQFVSTFKRFCNKECGENIWQTRSHDHIIRNYEDYEKHLKYIYENPLRWQYDELYNFEDLK